MSGVQQTRNDDSFWNELTSIAEAERARRDCRADDEAGLDRADAVPFTADEIDAIVASVHAGPAARAAAPLHRPRWRSRAAIWPLLAVALMSMVATLVIWKGRYSTFTLPFEAAVQLLAEPASTAEDRPPAMARILNDGLLAIEALRRIAKSDSELAPDADEALEQIRAALGGSIWVGPVPTPDHRLELALEELDNVDTTLDQRAKAIAHLREWVPMGIYMTRANRDVDDETRAMAVGAMKKYGRALQ